jgi:hypothetical protein
VVAAMRPWRLAGPARGMRVLAPSALCQFDQVAAAKIEGSLVLKYSSTSKPPDFPIEDSRIWLAPGWGERRRT